MNGENLIKALETQVCPPITSAEFTELMIQLGINLVVLFIISRILYMKWNRNPEYLFAQFISGVTVFMICALLRWVKLELGLVLGLFAIFSIIRFRTINVPVKDMAYLFMTVGISAVNALLSASTCLQWILISNCLLILLTLILEISFFNHPLASRTITFENTELLKPSRQQNLIQELKSLTGLDIIKFEIVKADYIKKHAQIKIFFPGMSGERGEVTKGNDED
jgi:hypothetical protein